MWIGSPGMEHIFPLQMARTVSEIMDQVRLGVGHGLSTAAVPITGPWILTVIGVEVDR